MCKVKGSWCIVLHPLYRRYQVKVNSPWLMFIWGHINMYISRTVILFSSGVISSHCCQCYYNPSVFIQSLCYSVVYNTLISEQCNVIRYHSHETWNLNYYLFLHLHTKNSVLEQILHVSRLWHCNSCRGNVIVREV